MSRDRRSPTMIWWDEQPLRPKIAIDPLTKESRDAFNREYEKHVEEMRKDWEHLKFYHTCFFCGEQSHEDELIRNVKGYWIHPECEMYWQELELNMKNKKL